MKFKMNPGAEAELQKMAFEAISKALQPVLDGLLAEYTGQPVDTIKPVLAERWAAVNEGASISDPELTTVAQALSDGKRVIFTDGKLITE